MPVHTSEIGLAWLWDGPANGSGALSSAAGARPFDLHDLAVRTGRARPLSDRVDRAVSARSRLSAVKANNAEVVGFSPFLFGAFAAAGLAARDHLAFDYPPVTAESTSAMRGEPASSSSS